MRRGYLYFVGRRDHQIKTAGYRVSPTEIEEIVLHCSDVRQAAVVGVDDFQLGQRIECSLVPVDETTDAQTIVDRTRRHVASELPAYMVPKRIRVVRHLPLTSSGKIDYAELKRQHAENSSAPRERAARMNEARTNPTESQVRHAESVQRLIDRNFARDHGELAIDGRAITQLASRFGTPLYVYSQRLLQQAWNTLRATYPSSFRILYSMKANPHRDFLQFFLALGSGIEIASAGELRAAVAAGAAPELLVFAGSGQNRSRTAGSRRCRVG